MKDCSYSYCQNPEISEGLCEVHKELSAQRRAAQLAEQKVKTQAAENSKFREVLELIAECELGFEGIEARKVLGICEPTSNSNSNQESFNSDITSASTQQEPD